MRTLTKISLLFLLLSISLNLFSCATSTPDPLGSSTIDDTKQVETTASSSDITTDSETTSSDVAELNTSHLMYLFSGLADAILYIDGTFTDVKITPNLEDVIDEYQETYGTDGERDPARLPLAVYLIRKLNLTKEDYMVYREKGNFTFTDEDIDKLFSDDDTVRETFRNPYTVHFEGKVYNIHMLKNLMKDNPEEYSRIPKEKLQELNNRLSVAASKAQDYLKDMINDYIEASNEFIKETGGGPHPFTKRYNFHWTGPSGVNFLSETFSGRL